MTASRQDDTKSSSVMQIDEHGPGCILADIESMLRFLEGGVRSTGKFHLLPMARLFELDEMMTHPLRPKLVRPQQRAFPDINAMYMLLRASELMIPEGQGKTTGQLKINPIIHEQWQQLNATERYFALLETWLRHATFGIFPGDGQRWSSRAGNAARRIWITSERVLSRRDSPVTVRELAYAEESASTLALFRLFGFMTVESPHQQTGEQSVDATVKVTPWGKKLLEDIFEAIEREPFYRDVNAPAYGAWQSFLQPLFPEYVNVIEFYKPEFRDGTYHFKVSLGSIWRRISITSVATLMDLADNIIKAFGFDGDHLSQFAYVARNGSSILADHPRVRDTDTWMDDILIGDLPLDVRQSMKFLYDFGASWRFSVKLEKIESGQTRKVICKITESHGEAPDEYEYG